VLKPKAVAAMLVLVADPQRKIQTLGTARAVCFNAQRVNVAAGNELLFVSDLDPVVGTCSAAFDPQVSPLANSTVLAVQPTAGFDNEDILMVLVGELALGDSLRTLRYQTTTADAPAATSIELDGRINAAARPQSADDKDSKQRPELDIDGDTTSSGEIIHDPAVPARNTPVELTDQDSVRFHTSVKIPNGGGVLLAGALAQFKHLHAPDHEIVMLIQASVIADKN
jgi:hypothetical protein